MSHHRSRLSVKVEMPRHAKIPGLRLNVLMERPVDPAGPLLLGYWEGTFRLSHAQLMPFEVATGDRIRIYLEALGGPLLGFRTQEAVVPPSTAAQIEVVFRPRPILFGLLYRRPSPLEFRIEED